MKRTIAKTTLVVVFATLFVLGIAPNTQAGEDEHKECSNATLHGSYGFTATGTVAGIGPVAEVGRATFDGKGNSTRTGTRSDGTTETVTGTYTVNPDCTGSGKDTGSSQAGEIPNFVIDDDGREIRSIVFGPGVVITVVATKQFTNDD